jgi:acyl carrier protein
MINESNMKVNDPVLALVIEKIRSTINEDWIQDIEIERSTRFNDDLEIESIEFIKIANAIQQHYGARLDVAGWLSGKGIHELIALSVGDLSDYVTAALAREG